MSHEAAILQYRSQLHFLAEKMVGSMQDAEDIVQDTFEKWMTIDLKKINCARSYLFTAVTNNCINFLESGKNQMMRRAVDIYENSSLVEDAHSYKSMLSFDIQSQIAEAWKILHYRLEPLEKAVYVLRELFEVNYDELQDIFEEKNDNLRKLFSRARQKLREKSTLKTPSVNLPEISHSFDLACAKGSLAAIISDLRKEISARKKK
jgi:RNA polymerase sigma-70 factor (ECF subfamily)